MCPILHCGFGGSLRSHAFLPPRRGDKVGLAGVYHKHAPKGFDQRHFCPCRGPGSVPFLLALRKACSGPARDTLVGMRSRDKASNKGLMAVSVAQRVIWRHPTTKEWRISVKSDQVVSTSAANTSAEIRVHTTVLCKFCLLSSAPHFRSRSTARKPMSRRQKPCGKSILSAAA